MLGESARAAVLPAASGFALLGLGLQEATVVAVAVIVGVFALIRGRGDTWKSNFEAEKAQSAQLQHQLTEAQKRISTLEASPSLEKLYHMIASHDEKEQVVWERVADALAQITGQLDAIAVRLTVRDEA